MSFQIFNPEELGPHSGWNNGLLASGGGRILFVAGQTGRDATGRVTAESFAGQFAGALRNVLRVVQEAGGLPDHIGRLTIYVTDRAEYLASRHALGEAYRKILGRHYPAMALVEVRGLVDPGAKVEIEATAVLP